ncbi:MAG: hypothetical protein HY291_14245 [Planctomycetes bacterium]|nr:hypothetical protein [Planctomycetota bacterium]
MSDPEPTGNPIFDFRAGFRRKASAVQNGLMLGGLGLFAAWSILFFSRLQGEYRDGILAGMCTSLIAMLSGIVWGFLWRRKLRQDFQRAFGPKS